jgi:hypothetical protein
MKERMKTKAIIFILAALFMVPICAQAQLGSKLKKKIGETVSKVVQKEATTEEQDTTQVNTEGQEAEQENTGRQMNLPKLGMGRVTAKYEENYDFKGLIKMRNEMYEKGKQEAVAETDMWLDADNNNIGMETTSIATKDGSTMSNVTIMDMKNKAMMTFNVVDGGKSGMIMPIPDSLQAEASEETVDLTDNVKIRKTGNTRTILGYRCDEYEVTEEGSNETSNVWTTEDIDFKANKKLLGGQQGMPKGFGKGQLKGLTLASESYEKGQLTSKMDVTKIDMNETHSISTAGVSFIQMNFLKWGQKKK